MDEQPDLSKVFEALKSLDSKWEELATHVGLAQETVEVLKASREDALREVIRHWLVALGQGGSWDSILQVVQKVDQELADEVRGKYCSGEEGSDGVESKMEGASEEKMDTAPEEVNGAVEGSHGEGNDAHKFSDGWSKLSREEVIDRVKGLIYGQAIGDALGLATEFMSKKEAKEYYKGGLSYENIVQDFHRSRWDKSDWTDDTDQMLLILLMLVEKNGQVDRLDFAAKLHNWMCKGFEELGDRGGMGIGMTVGRTLQHPKFLHDPTTAAQEIWEASGRYLAANGAIMRTSILGAHCFNEIPKVVANTLAIARITHADPRCSASCVAVTTAIALMLQGAYSANKKDDLAALIKQAMEEGKKLLEHKDQKKEMKKYMECSLKDMKLDDRQTIGYTFKALGAGFYGLRKGVDFKTTITEVIMEAGDADSNASVCGALMGCKLGFRALPEDLLQFHNREWLDKKVDSFLKVTGLA